MKKTILFISPSIKVKGGISTVIKELLSTDLPQKFNILKVSSHVDGNRIKKLFIAIIGLIKTCYYLLFNNIQIVHIHGSDVISSTRKYLFFKLIKKFNCKVIYHFHGAFFLEQYQRIPKFWKLRIKYLFENSDLMICLSQSWKRAILEIAPKTRITVIPNAIHLPEASRIEGVKNSSCKLTFLGLIGERKGVFDLLKVVKRLNDDGYQIELNIGGNGEIDRLQNTIEELNIQKHVKFLGWLDSKKKDELLQRTDIFILPSYGEGMPMSIMEAMSYGIPVISTRVGGIPELVPNGEAGYLINPGNINALYEKIVTLAKDPQLRRKFGEEGRRIIKEKHHLTRVAQQIKTIYEMLNNRDFKQNECGQNIRLRD